MNYKLSKLQLGTGKLELILNVSTPFEITETCFVNGFGHILLFKEHHCLGLIDKKNTFVFPWGGIPDQAGYRDSTSPLFEFPSSACYCKSTNKVYVVEKGGSRIRKLDLDPFYGASVFGQAVQKKMSGYMTNFEDFSSISTSCCVDAYGDIYWMIREINRGFKYRFKISDFEPYIGTGKYGFSLSSNPVMSLVAFPSSVLCRGSSVYIADSGNHCIRDGVRVIIGCPNKIGDENDYGVKSVLNTPRKMIPLKDLICFIDEGKIKYYSLKDKTVGTLYVSHNIISIESDEKDLIIVEKQK
jgi:hypothetical protein